ncbi:hypothetical protein L1887_11031 [Cichorium endivia]|nr:hypothetical protein L1887_11031 [Cichorium endivia]
MTLLGETKVSITINTPKLIKIQKVSPKKIKDEAMVEDYCFTKKKESWWRIREAKIKETSVESIIGGGGGISHRVLSGKAGTEWQIDHSHRQLSLENGCQQGVNEISDSVNSKI